MAQAEVAIASVAITPMPFFCIWALIELEALQKWPPGAVESSRPGRKTCSLQALVGSGLLLHQSWSEENASQVCSCFILDRTEAQLHSVVASPFPGWQEHCGKIMSYIFLLEQTLSHLNCLLSLLGDVSLHSRK